MTYTVRTEGLGKRFGSTTALSGLDLAVESGTVLGLLGHNGAGKTTLLRLAIGLCAVGYGVAIALLTRGSRRIVYWL